MSRKHTSRCRGLLVAGLLLIAVTAAGCGESDEEKAQTQVCDARADLKQQIDDLSGLTVGTATVDGVKESLSAIEDDLTQMTDAEGDLSDERKQQVESATKAFASDVKAIANGLASDLSLSGAKEELESAVQQLGSSYQETFAQVDCG